MSHDRRVKISVFLPEPVHHRFKVAATEKRTSLQRILGDVITARVQINEPLPAETLDCVALLDRINEPAVQQGWLDRLERVMMSGDRLAVLTCAAKIEASEQLIQNAPEL